MLAGWSVFILWQSGMPLWLVFMVSVLLLFWVVRRARETVWISGDGIHFRSEGRSGVVRDGSFSWQETTAVYSDGTLWLTGPDEAKGFVLRDWIEAGESYEGQHSRTGPVEQHPIYGALVAHGILVQTQSELVAVPRKSIKQAIVPAELVWGGVFILLVGYGVGGPLVVDDRYVDRSYLACILPAALAGLLVARYFVTRVFEKKNEQALSIVMAGIACAWASWTMALQINGEGIPYRTVPYTYTGSATFSALGEDTPELRLSRFSSYWDAFSPGTVHSFAIREGRLGFVQINVKAIEDDYWEWHRTKSVLDREHI